ncbi:putative quinol monooxygenase [Granulosicoccus sp. 3-233]|uniref:putative quinol monooxygenase n=1 Tax=Granulosicoccus sp. 3-233 TaxID=3417969 RepID=UPI003D32B6C8
MIHVVAILTAKPGKGPELLEAIAKVVPQVHAEKGCIEYQPVTDAENAGASQDKVGPDSLVVIEKWDTLDDLKAHSASAHMAAFGKSVADIMVGKTVHVLD